MCAVKFHVHDKTAETEVVWAISCVHDSDFDGTLAPLRDRPEEVRLAPAVEAHADQRRPAGALLRVVIW